jgi:hypothetical protein
LLQHQLEFHRGRALFVVDLEFAFDLLETERRYPDRGWTFGVEAALDRLVVRAHRVGSTLARRAAARFARAAS